MTYTFLHRGVVMGESDFSGATLDPRHKSGDFRPTPYGRTILPRVTGALSAEMALAKYLKSVAPNRKQLSAQKLEALLFESEAGRAVIDVARVLSEVELRGPDGKRLEFEVIAFCDIEEFRRLSAALGTYTPEQLNNLSPETPEFTVSLMLSRKTHSARLAGRGAVGAAGRRFEH